MIKQRFIMVVDSVHSGHAERSSLPEVYFKTSHQWKAEDNLCTRHGDFNLLPDIETGLKNVYGDFVCL
jgi:hypothetical protein